MNLVSVTAYVIPSGPIVANPVTLLLNSENFIDVKPYTNALSGSIATIIRTKEQKNNLIEVVSYQVSNTVANILSASASSTGAVSSGQTALVAGTIAITIPGLTTANKGFITRAVSNTTTSTAEYRAVCTANTLTLTADLAAGTINVADISTLNWFVL